MKKYIFLVLSIITLNAEERVDENKNDKTVEQNCSKQTNRDDRESFAYFDMGIGPFPLLIPTFGIGGRTQYKHIGADLALDVSTIYYVTCVKFTPSVLYYPSVNLNSQFYAGLGAGCASYFINKKKFKDSAFCFSPELIFGKKYKNSDGKNRFFESRIGFPTIGKVRKKGKKILYYPIVYFKYGISF
jgi:hypothetical protein